MLFLQIFLNDFLKFYKSIPAINRFQGIFSKEILGKEQWQRKLLCPRLLFDKFDIDFYEIYIYRYCVDIRLS